MKADDNQNCVDSEGRFLMPTLRRNFGNVPENVP